jgi:hypothetical protein
MKHQIMLSVWNHYLRQHTAGLPIGRGAITHAASELRCCTSTVRRVMTEYDPAGLGIDAPHRLLVSDERPAKAAARPNKVNLPPECERIAKSFVHKRLCAGATVTWHELHVHIKDRIPLSEEVSEYVFRKRMMDFGFASLRTRTGARVDMQSDYWLRQKERFILQLSWALEQERNGEAVVFFMDESFVQVRHQRSRSIVSLGDDRDVHQLRRGGLRALVRSGTGRGTLLIVVHCISRDGLLVARDKDGNELDTAQQIYQSGTTASYEHTSSKEDDRERYHKHWNSDSMLLWARDQFFPTARRIYGWLMRFIMVLDNSGNHTARPDGYVSASKASTKPELADALRAGGVKELEVDRMVTPVARADTRAAKRNGRVTPVSVAPALQRKRIAHDKWCQLPAHGGVSQEEMIASLKDLYRLKPELEESQLSRLFREGVSISQSASHSRLLTSFSCLSHVFIVFRDQLLWGTL